MSEKPYTLKGTVVEVGEVQVVTDKFSKRTLVIQTLGDYPQDVPIDFGNKSIECLEDIEEGAEVEVDFYLGGFKSQKGYRGATLKGVGCKTSEGPF